MNQPTTVESRVLEILKACPKSRYDDMLLILHYPEQKGNRNRSGKAGAYQARISGLDMVRSYPTRKADAAL